MTDKSDKADRWALAYTSSVNPGGNKYYQIGILRTTSSENENSDCLVFQTNGPVKAGKPFEGEFGQGQFRILSYTTGKSVTQALRSFSDKVDEKQKDYPDLSHFSSGRLLVRPVQQDTLEMILSRVGCAQGNHSEYAFNRLYSLIHGSKSSPDAPSHSDAKSSIENAPASYGAW